MEKTYQCQNNKKIEVKKLGQPVAEVKKLANYLDYRSKTFMTSTALRIHFYEKNIDGAEKA